MKDDIPGDLDVSSATQCWFDDQCVLSLKVYQFLLIVFVMLIVVAKHPTSGVFVGMSGCNEEYGSHM